MKEQITGPKFKWSDGGYHSQYYEFKFHNLNCEFNTNVYAYRAFMDIRVKAAHGAYFTHFATAADWTEANAIVYNFMAERIKKTAKFINLLEFDGTNFPSFDWKETKNVNSAEMALDVPSFGCSFYLSPLYDSFALYKSTFNWGREQLCIKDTQKDINEYLFYYMKNSIKSGIDEINEAYLRVSD